MMTFALLLSLSLAGCAAASNDSAAPPDTTMTLFDFADTDPARWGIVNDGVMGGRSQGYVSVDGGALRFTGNLVTRGGGFTSVRVRKRVDLSAYDGVELRVRGGGRTFEVEVSDGSRIGRRDVSRRAPFETTDEWTWVRVPFDALTSTAHGEPVSAGSLDQTRVEQLALYIADGQDGPFELQVDEIRVYTD